MPVSRAKIKAYWEKEGEDEAVNSLGEQL